MRQSEGLVTLRTPLLLLGLWVVLAPAQHSQGRPSWRYISSEVVIPRKELNHGKGIQTPDWLSYSLSFGGQRHVIHMRRKKLFWPRHLVMMTQDDQGALQVDYPFVPLDCYYFGYLEEVPFSTVTVDTCYGGLIGMMKLDDLAYEIKPLKDSQRFEHIVSQIMADANATGPTYTLRYKEERRSLFSQVNASAASRLSTTQLTARSFGLYYDDDYCYCQRRTTCIMYRFPLITDAFSNCSMLHAGNVVNYNRKHCSYNTEFQYFNRSLTLALCGNSVVDDGEQCDCGSFKQCYSNPCCTSDCSFTPGSACNSGRCCTNCTYSPPGTLCRTIQNICDLPEYCTGQTFTCPEDVYLQDGTPCSEDGYCYHGNCTDRTMHCKEIFGEGAVKGADSCYLINKRGHRFGQCTSDSDAKLMRCANTDVQCGRLQCTNVTHLPRLQEHVGFHQSVLEGYLCFGLDLHLGSYTTDVGHVRLGTPCGGGHFCNNSICSGSVAAINYDCHPSKCNLRGICNSKRNCHCHVGWDPPQCIHKGAGGSVDSGPPPRRMRSVRQSDMSVVYLRVVFGRMYAFIAALLFGVATNTSIIKMAKFQDKERILKAVLGVACEEPWALTNSDRHEGQ
ncbi:disintegrin and metalloproteinase domain-containing protein 20-like [Desmodus rotundus]|uniref:disintegrin and metalloproteinase domain-containing protein 20-like n=1 Tax=Desmodus rotundus TaxID=9430 RepID=UPI002381400E|nr:disintegrin and metalloproteinase domain-containing protein 20-like [Desmodus rotundus]